MIWGLGIAGWALSYALFVRWLSAHGWDLRGGYAEAFSASIFAAGLLSDLVVVSLMMVVVALWDRGRLGPRWTAAVIASLALSVSMSLAVYVIGLSRHRAAQD